MEKGGLKKIVTSMFHCSFSISTCGFTSPNISDAVEVPAPVSSHHHHHYLFPRFHHHDQNHVHAPAPPPPPPLPLSVSVDFDSCQPTRLNNNKKKIQRNTACDEEEEAGVPFSSDDERNKQIKGEERGPTTSDQFYNISNAVVGEGMAVVKNSDDPYGDFRSSVMEMIIENDIVRPKELEQLLKSYLALNSHYHHTIILQVFCDVWDALFSN